MIKIHETILSSYEVNLAVIMPTNDATQNCKYAVRINLINKFQSNLLWAIL